VANAARASAADLQVITQSSAILQLGLLSPIRFYKPIRHRIGVSQGRHVGMVELVRTSLGYPATARGCHSK
jgi:hypothetical protein